MPRLEFLRVESPVILSPSVIIWHQPLSTILNVDYKLWISFSLILTGTKELTVTNTPEFQFHPSAVSSGNHGNSLQLNVQRVVSDQILSQMFTA